MKTVRLPADASTQDRLLVSERAAMRKRGGHRVFKADQEPGGTPHSTQGTQSPKVKTSRIILLFAVLGTTLKVPHMLGKHLTT